MEKTCQCCIKKFIPHPAVKNQQYCGNPDCQRVRKRKWQKEKLTRDPDYRENQARAQRDWQSRNPDYWKEYRKRKRAYTEQNRLCQRERNRRRSKIAKMDELHAKVSISSGRYRLVPLYGTIAKMDELIVEIDVVSRGYAIGE
jgi:hypothetical protein